MLLRNKKEHNDGITPRKKILKRHLNLKRQSVCTILSLQAIPSHGKRSQENGYRGVEAMARKHTTFSFKSTSIDM